jgi:thioredoxin-like negative regulator of GroEL
MRLAKILIIRTDDRRRMRRRAKRRLQLQMAAAVLLIMGAGAVLLASGYISDPASDLAALATTETIPQSHVGLRFRLAAPASPGGYESEFRAGMEALVREDYSDGIAILESLHAAHPSETEISTYLGVALYLSGDDSDRAKALLAQGGSHMQGRVRRTATWYLANSCLRSGDVESAVQLLKSIDSEDTDARYTRYAAELLRRIRGVRTK